LLIRSIITATATTAIVLAANAGGADAQQRSAFDHIFQSIDGGTLELSQWRGKVLLVVNTASFCGFTRQYEGLQKLWEQYEAKGLVVVGVPSNDFGAQEPKAEAEIKNFCQGAFGVTFPLTAKYEVKGPNAHAFYSWAAGALGPTAQPKWNFHKLLIARDGTAVGAYPSSTEPLSATLVQAIERELAR
jgi:glutathione peroxidase